MQVVIIYAAKPDFIEIGDYIRPHSPNRAITFFDERLDRCAALGDMPQGFPLVPRYEHHGIRLCVHRDYLNFSYP